jgi:hypothetical protein
MAQKKDKKNGSVAGMARDAKAKASGETGGGGWFQSGYDAVGEEVARRDKQQEEWANQTRRFWMPEKDRETHKTVVAPVLFVDGIPFTYREHGFYIDGSWKNWQTCLVGTGSKCPYDEAGNKNYFVGAYTVLDGREWVSKDKTVHKWDMCLYPAKGDALKALKILAEARGNDLAGCLFRVSRSGDKSPSVGNVFDFVERLPTKKITIKFTGMAPREITVLDTTNPTVGKKLGIQFKGQIKPIDYSDVVKPKTREKALIWMGGKNIQAGSEGGESAQEVAY